MKHQTKILIPLLSLSFAIGFAAPLASCAGSPSARAEKKDDGPAKVVTTKPGKSETSKGRVPASCETETSLSRNERLAIISNAMLNAEKEVEQEVEKNPAAFELPDARAVVGTFAANSVPDTARFISFDQQCFHDLYEAQQNLADGDEDGAAQNANAWLGCIESKFPTRLAIARPYAACFGKPRPGKSH